MPEKKLLVVVGATGAQGGSVINTFIDLPEWRIRGLTRSPSSAKAQALVSRGIEVVEADLNDPSSLMAAFEGAYAIFSVTDGWALLGDPAFQQKAKDVGKASLEYAYDHELQLGKNVFDAAAKVPGLERLIFSSLSDASKWSGGKYTRVFHFDAKAHAVEYGKNEYPDLWEKTSIIQLGWYLSNWSSNHHMRAKKSDDGIVDFVIGVPKEQQFPLVAPEFDTGPFVLALMHETPGKNLIAYRAWMSMRELIDLVAKIKGVQTRCTAVQMDRDNPDEFVSGYAENMGYITEFGYEGRADESIMHPRELEKPPFLGSVSEWVKKTDWSAVF